MQTSDLNEKNKAVLELEKIETTFKTSIDQLVNPTPEETNSINELDKKIDDLSAQMTNYIYELAERIRSKFSPTFNGC